MKRLSQELFPFFAIAALVSAIGVVTIGSIVRVTGSGLGCPDWPLCHGQIIPPWDLAAWLEYTHRLSAATASLFTALTALAAFGVYAGRRRELLLTLVPLPLLLAQVVLGALNVLFELPPETTLSHTAIAMLYVATLGLVVSGTPAFRGLSSALRPALAQRPDLRGVVLTTAVALLATIIVGSAVTRFGASLVCVAFPHCGTEADRPLIAWLQVIQMTHRVAAFVVAGLVLWLVAIAWRTTPSGGGRHGGGRHGGLPLLWAALAALLVAAQIGLGVANVLLLLPLWSRVGHLTTAALLFTTLVLLVGTIWRTTPAEREDTSEGATDLPPWPPLRHREGGGFGARGRPGDAAIPALDAPSPPRPVSARRVAETAEAYFRLTKPNVIVLLLITTLAAMLAAGRPLSVELVLAVLVGGYLYAGGANAFNSCLDHDIDAMMKRTRHRPLPTGRISRQQAFWFALAVSVLAVVSFWVLVNPLSALLGAVALLYYVVVYSLWLKRRSVHNVVIGGAAGAFPPLIGWTAATGSIEPAALAMFVIIFFWTPPHAWALALLVKDEYQRAQVPMLPVVVGEKETCRRIWLSSLLFVAITLVPVALRLFGVVYLLMALALGIPLLLLAYRLYRSPGDGPPRERVRQVYKYSTLYLALFFTGMVVDAHLGV